MDPSFSKEFILNFRHKETKQREERLPLRIGHVVRHHLEIIIFNLNNPQPSERHMEIEEELTKLLAKETKLEDSYIKQRFLKQPDKKKYHGPEIIHSFLFPP